VVPWFTMSPINNTFMISHGPQIRSIKAFLGGLSRPQPISDPFYERLELSCLAFQCLRWVACGNSSLEYFVYFLYSINDNSNQRWFSWNQLLSLTEGPLYIYIYTCMLIHIDIIKLYECMHAMKTVFCAIKNVLHIYVHTYNTHTSSWFRISKCTESYMFQNFSVLKFQSFQKFRFQNLSSKF
jgi:hypothetical protein